MEYRTLFVVRHCIPDGRLAMGRVNPNGLLEFWVRRWHIHPDLVQALATVSADVAEMRILDFEPGRTEGPSIESQLVRVEGQLLDGEVMHMRSGVSDRLWFEVLIDEHLATPEFVRDMNAEAFPAICQVLVPKAPAEGLLCPVR